MTHVAFVESNFTGSGVRALGVARALGFEVTFITSDVAQYVGGDGHGRFDEAIDTVVSCDTTEPAAIVDALHREGLARRLDGVIAVGEYHVAIAAAVARSLGLPGADPVATQIARDKSRTLTRCAAAGIRIPRFGRATDCRTALELADQLGLPCVIKPHDESASLGVRLCSTRDDARRHSEALLSRRANHRGLPRRPTVIVQEHLAGDEVSVETLSDGREHVVLGITDKQVSAPPYFIETGHTFPSCLGTAEIEACTHTARAALDAIGLRFGAAHTELKMTSDGPALVEINARVAGDRLTEVVELSTGISILRELIRLYVGTAPELVGHDRRGVALRFLDCPAGVIIGIHGVRDAARLPGVVDVRLNVAVGDVVADVTTNHGRRGQVLVVAESPREASRIADDAVDRIEIVVEPPVACGS
jgi:S-sulfo-L-cysteine synthase (3-phospho-L-serine-dependent)